MSNLHTTKKEKGCFWKQLQEASAITAEEPRQQIEDQGVGLNGCRHNRRERETVSVELLEQTGGRSRSLKVNGEQRECGDCKWGDGRLRLSRTFKSLKGGRVFAGSG